MNQNVIQKIEQEMLQFLDNKQLQRLHLTLVTNLEPIFENKNQDQVKQDLTDQLFNEFISAKRV